MNSIGIPYEHAYTVLDVFEVTFKKGLVRRKTVTAVLVKVRNGNRKGEYSGPWRVEDKNWSRLTIAERKNMGYHTNMDKGIFFIDLPSYQ